MSDSQTQPSEDDTQAIRHLIDRCARRDTEALREFFRLYSQDIYNFPIKVFHLDEDQASDFFLYAFERLKNGQRFASFQGRSQFRTWFYTVLRNLVIDWMRTVRKLETIPLKTARDYEGGDSQTAMENIADPRGDRDQADLELAESLSERLLRLPLESRVLFKLSYIFYLHLDYDELAYLTKTTGKSEAEVLEKLAQLKNELATKSLKNIESLDKITSLYLNIRELKSKRKALQEELQHLSPGTAQWSGPHNQEIGKLDQLIQKKERQRARLLEKKERGNFIVRTPHKKIAELLGISEGSVSVQLNRIAEKIQKNSGSV